MQKVGNGHPGTAMSLAPAAYLLFQRVMRHDPADPKWPGRDRFVLSCGHSSLTLYIQLYLSGYGLGLDDLKAFRTWGSITPGHPEHGLTPGVETTTGPLGQGLGNAVGMAMAARRERGLLDPDAAPGASPFDHFVYAIASDGDIEEGITHEASAIAAVQELGNLVVIYDDNHISIEDNTVIAKSEDVGARYEAYGWHVQHVSWVTESGYEENVQALYDAIEAAKAVTGKPSFIVLRTIIGWPAPNKQNTGAAHGSALGDAEVAATKEILGFDPAVTFPVEEEALNRAREVAARGKALHAEWDAQFAEWEKENPERGALFARLSARELPEGWEAALPEFPADPKGTGDAPQASGKVLTALAPVLPELWGGSADLAESNITTMKGEPSFLPAQPAVRDVAGQPLRAHAALRHPRARHGRHTERHHAVRPHPALRRHVPAVQRLHARRRAAGGADGACRSTFVWTHDSIGLGEDGPTHQPVEHLWSLRNIPHLDVVRPADANETAVAWKTILEKTDRPAALCLSRQNVPTFDRVDLRAGRRRGRAAPT